MNILIVEDDLRVAEVIERGLVENQMQTTRAYDGVSALKLCRQNSYDLVISDIILPKMDGLDLCKELRILLPGLPIILLTALGTTDDKVEGFDAGADDYLVKPFEMRELVARVKALVNRSGVAAQQANKILKYCDLEMNLDTKLVQRSSREIKLTPKEFMLLQYLMENPERVLSKNEIAEKVWGIHFDPGTNFMNVYINYLRKKIDRDHPKKLIQTQFGMGFMLKDDGVEG